MSSKDSHSYSKETGHIYTFTVVHVGFGHMAKKAPYVLAIVDFENQEKVTAVIEDVTNFDSIKIGDLVKWKRLDEQIGPIYSQQNHS
mgnify:CR=1 FL=1|jgi:uncharacterized OB-fold protein